MTGPTTTVRFWLVLHEYNAPRVLARTGQRPALKAGEIAVLMQVRVPDALFRPPVPEATIELPAPDPGSTGVTVAVPPGVMPLVFQVGVDGAAAAVDAVDTVDAEDGR